jgi:orotate phosphoribosyltransferase-like protein
MRTSQRSRAALVASALALGGCEALGITAAGVGMATGVSHTLNGRVYKTFTSAQSQVKQASIGALNRMQIKVVSTKRDGAVETIAARADNRDIEIELEALTKNTTRMLVIARKDGGILRDESTAAEVVLQTEKLVGKG